MHNSQKCVKQKKEFSITMLKFTITVIQILNI